MPLKDVANYCEICKVQYEGGYLAYTEHSASREHKIMIQIDSLIYHMNYAAERLAELNSEYIKVPRYIPDFGTVDTCAKCNHQFIMATPTSKYDHIKNVLVRGCAFCGATWLERCADGTQPNWEKIT